MEKLKIETDRMMLRHFTMDDLDAMAEVMADPEVMKFSLSGPYSREKTRDFLNRCLNDYEERGLGLYAVVLKEENEVLGYCGIVYQDIDGEELPEIGYRLHRDYWGKGLATEAAKAVQDFGFSRFGFPKMISVIEAENVGSIRVAEKNGFRFEKETVFKDQVPVRIYSVSA